MDILDTCLNQPAQEPSKQKEKKLVDIQVTNENIALNLMVSFLSLANKRGAFGIDESAKIWECVQLFQKSD
jgi:hypothetical protein